MRLLLPLIILSSVISLHAQPQTGKELYSLYCSACHGLDGIGAKSNPNPPLAGSEWIQGEPDRAAAAVLNGLIGPIEVNGAAYNLAMPPQGAVLSDEQLAKILTHIRTSFGNKEKPVSTEQVTQIREKWTERQTPFTAAELKKEYPLVFPNYYPKISNLVATVYKGKWETMPNFSQLTPYSAEEEASNRVDLAHSTLKKEFAIVWTGDITFDAEKPDWYRLVLNASDGARVFINDELMMEVKGVGPMGSERAVKKSFRTAKATYPLRVEYFHNSSETPGLVFRSARGHRISYLSDSRLATNPGRKSIPITPEKGSTRIYPNFIKGATARAIGVGYKLDDGKGYNLAFSPEYLGPDLMWSGDFIDAGRHWSGRGQGYEKPAGSYITDLLQWNAYVGVKDLKTKFLGYALNEKRQPTFRYRLGDCEVQDFFKPVPGGFERTLTFSKIDSLPETLRLVVMSGSEIELGSETIVTSYTGLSVTSPTALHLWEGNEKKTVSLPLNSLTGDTQSITLRYQWAQ